MATPDAFRLRGRDWTIEVKDDFVTEAEADGMCLKHQQRVILTSEIRGQYAAEVLTHELLHAAWSASSLDASEAKEHEELIVSTLAPSVLDLIIQNPKIIAYLKELHKD